MRNLAFILLLCICNSLYSEKISQRVTYGFEPVKDQVQVLSSGAVTRDESRREFWSNVIINYVCYATKSTVAAVSLDLQQLSAVDSYDGQGSLSIPVTVLVEDTTASVILDLRGVGLCDSPDGGCCYCVRVGLSGGVDGRARFETVASLSLW